MCDDVPLATVYMPSRVEIRWEVFSPKKISGWMKLASPAKVEESANDYLGQVFVLWPQIQKLLFDSSLVLNRPDIAPAYARKFMWLDFSDPFLTVRR